MSKILKNTTLSPIAVGDTGITIQVSPTDYTIPPQDYPLWASSSDTVTQVGAGNIIVNDGSNDLSISDGVDLIKGIFPNPIGIASGTNRTPIGNINDSLKTNVKFRRDEQLDAWGRVRASIPTTLFELNFNFSKKELNMNEKLVSGGTATYSYDDSGVNLTVPTTSGASVVRQTKRYFRYITGKGMSVLTAIIPGPAKANVFKGWGYFDANDGMFFRQTGSGFAVVIRSSTSGSPVDTVINQADWNIDKMDGTGISGVTLDPEKYNVWVVEFAWQGAGGVRFGVFMGGYVNYVHEFRPANILTEPFTRTPILPVRYEITNTGTAASSTKITHGTLGLIVDGPSSILDATQGFSTSREATPKSLNTTLSPVLAIRPKLLIDGETNRVPIELQTLTITAETQTIYWELVKNVTITGGTWSSVNSISAVERNTTATSYSGGTVLDSGYVLASSQGNTTISGSTSSSLDKLNFIGLDIDGSAQENLILVARTITSTTNSFATMKWQELD